MWLAWALLGVTFASGAVILDKTVLDARERTVAGIAVLAGLLAGVTSILLFAAGGIPHLGQTFVLCALGGGALLFAYLPPYFAALRDSSADRVVAWFQMTPLIAVAAAAIVLSQRLSGLQWAGAMCLVGGALVAEASAAGGLRLIRRRSIVLMLAAASIFAAAEVLLARASEDAPSFRVLIAMSGVGTAVAALAFWLVASRGARRLGALRQGGLRILALAELLNIVFVAAHQRALGLAPVGVVSATAGVQPLIIAGMLAIVGRATYVQRSRAAALVTGAAYLSISAGVALVAVGGNSR